MVPQPYIPSVIPETQLDTNIMSTSARLMAPSVTRSVLFFLPPGCPPACILSSAACVLLRWMPCYNTLSTLFIPQLLQLNNIIMHRWCWRWHTQITLHTMKDNILTRGIGYSAYILRSCLRGDLLFVFGGTQCGAFLFLKCRLEIITYTQRRLWYEVLTFWTPSVFIWHHSTHDERRNVVTATHLHVSINVVNGVL